MTRLAMMALSLAMAGTIASFAAGCGGSATTNPQNGADAAPAADAPPVVTDDGGLCTPTDTCASLGYTCGSFTDSCGSTQTCTPGCSGTDTCSSAHVCTPVHTGAGRPFGTHGGYHTPGVIFPSNHSQAELDDATASYYDAWKSRYIEPACVSGQFRISTGGGTGGGNDTYTVSEGHGYAMVVTAMMFGHDPAAQTTFDGLFRYFDSHHSSTNGALMAWAQNEDCENVEGPDSATDGDLDVAYALLLADRQWGSAGAIHYKAEALKVIAGILESDIQPANTLLVGDWVSPSDEHYNGTRPSDFMISHFKSFGAASGVARWSQVVDKTYALTAYIQGHQASATGLLPGFLVDANTATPAPAPANWLENPSDGRYDYNACRVPFRLATDFLMSGDTRSQVAVQKINAWIRGAAGGDPGNIKDGYQLNGNATGSGPDLCFVSPFAVSAMVESAGGGSNQTWLNDLWDEIDGRGLQGYYGDSVKMLCMLVLSGNWFVP
jgi:endo-1,4-beta-D-glucanase Y